MSYGPQSKETGAHEARTRAFEATLLFGAQQSRLSRRLRSAVRIRCRPGGLSGGDRQARAAWRGGCFRNHRPGELDADGIRAASFRAARSAAVSKLAFAAPPAANRLDLRAHYFFRERG